VSERRREEAEEGEDSTMADVVKVAESDIAADTPMAEADTQVEGETLRVTIDEPTEEGAVEEGESEDKMDTT
jgi:hypothetical protein